MERFPRKRQYLRPLFLVIEPKQKNKIQNDWPKFRLIGSISDISVASDFTTHQ